MASAISPGFSGMQPAYNLSELVYGSVLSSDDITALARPATPHSVGDEYRRFHQSPTFSASPELDYRRVRRKRSLVNLARSPAEEDWLSHVPSRDYPQQTLLHSFAAHELLPFPFRPAPTTPQPRQALGSPSLSSTVTTLQSTPNHTPILRGGSLEHWRTTDRSALTEPIRAKRKFSTLRQARRLPRSADGGGGGADDGLWQVYAAVFDPLTDYTGDLDSAVHSAKEVAVDPIPVLSGGRVVRFEEGIGATARPPLTISSSRQARLGKEETTASSSFALSRFAFPVPPGHDNWSNRSADPSPSASPATLHYRGASFDLVNPHASLLLDTHDFETPAEIDGLLDDYFADRSEISNMQSSDPAGDMGDMSSTSLRSASSNEQRTRVLYESASDARRNILGVQSHLQTPANAYLSHSSNSRMPPPVPPRSTKSPFETEGAVPSTNKGKGKAPAFMSIAGQTTLQQDRLSKNGGNAQLPGEASFAKIDLSSDRYNSLDAPRYRKHASDPFDLTISDNGEDDHRMIDEVLRQEYHAGVASFAAEGEDESDVPLPNERGKPQATLEGEDTDPTLKEIYGGYDYTRVPLAPLDSAVYISSPELERGLGVAASRDQPSSSGASRFMTQSTASAYRQSFVNLRRGQQQRDCAQAMGFGNTSFPTPPAPVYRGFANYQTSEVPTSEQTYGDTNELLRVTPESIQQRQTYSNFRGPYRGQVVPVHRFDIPPDAEPGPPRSAENWRYPHDNKENVPPYWSPEHPRGPPGDGDDDDDDLSMHPGFNFNFFDENEGTRSSRAMPRASSVYPDEHESSWVTEHTATQADLTRLRDSIGSYVDTSAYGSQHNLNPSYDGLPPTMYSPMRNDSFIAKANANRIPPVALDHAAEKLQHARDVKKAISLLQANIMNNSVSELVLTGGEAFDKAQRAADLRELERLRKEDRAAVQEACEIVRRSASGQILDKARQKAALVKSESKNTLRKINLFKPKYDPRNSVHKAQAFGLYQTNNDSLSDQRRLLQSPGTPSTVASRYAPGLEYSPTLNTFVTVKEDTPLMPTRRGQPQDWTPWNQDATKVALKSVGLPSPPTSTGANSIGSKPELVKGNERYRSSRAAINSQTKPIELRMLKPASSAPRHGPMTDADMLAKADRWGHHPTHSARSPLARYAAQHESAGNGPFVPCLTPRDDKDVPKGSQLYDERRAVSRRAMFTCMFFPPLSLLFGIGFFDKYAARKTGGRITTMAPKQKRTALWVALPLGTIAYAILIIAAVFVWKAVTLRCQENGAPFWSATGAC